MDKKVFTMLVVGVVCILIVVGGMLGMKKQIENNVTKKVMEQIRTEYMRDYVPGPYTPGFDPDKVNK